jgi:DNA-directed RNA polymerase subunit M/transcription elongation factor TFIIS
MSRGGRKPKSRKQAEYRSDLDQYSNIQDVYGFALINEQRLYDLESLIASGIVTREEVIAKLSANKWKSWTEALYHLYSPPDYENLKYLEYELLQNKTAPAIYSEPCPRCKSTDTKMVGSQERAADEAGTARIICNRCNFIAIM